MATRNGKLNLFSTLNEEEENAVEENETLPVVGDVREVASFGEELDGTIIDGLANGEDLFYGGFALNSMERSRQPLLMNSMKESEKQTVEIKNGTCHYRKLCNSRGNTRDPKLRFHYIAKNCPYAEGTKFLLKFKYQNFIFMYLKL